LIIVLKSHITPCLPGEIYKVSLPINIQFINRGFSCFKKDWLLMCSFRLPKLLPCTIREEFRDLLSQHMSLKGQDGGITVLTTEEFGFDILQGQQMFLFYTTCRPVLRATQPPIQ
jgi:hypothetical protein